MFFHKLFLPLYYSIRNALLGVPEGTTIAKRLAQKASKKAFRAYHDSKFRKGVSFGTLETVEQDRMFNELVVSNLVLEILILETFAKFANGLVKEHLRIIASDISKTFITSLRDLGISEEYLKAWLKLIALRQDEYEKMRIEHRDRFGELGSGNPWIQVVAIGCLFHIRRGKSISNDPLFLLCMEQAIAIGTITRQSIQPIVFSI